EKYACPECNISIEELSPRLFSFNNPYGACETCSGLGSMLEIDPDLVIPNKELSLMEGAIVAPGWSTLKEESVALAYFSALSRHYDFDLNTPVKDLSKEIMDIILYGTKGEKITVNYKTNGRNETFSSSFEGIINILYRRYRETSSD